MTKLTTLTNLKPTPHTALLTLLSPEKSVTNILKNYSCSHYFNYLLVDLAIKGILTKHRFMLCPVILGHPCVFACTYYQSNVFEEQLANLVLIHHPRALRHSYLSKEDIQHLQDNL